MADTKITALSELTSVADADLIAIVDDPSGTPTSKKITKKNLVKNIVNVDIDSSAAIDATKIADGSVTSTEFQHINSLSSNAQTQINLKAPIASPTFTGTVTTAAVDVAGNNIDNIQNLIHDISTTTTALDFSGDQVQTISISANTTFTTSNRATGKTKTIKITTDGSTRTLTFPAWKFVGTKPTEQAASKIGILTVTCFGTADTDVVAAYAVEE
jgi:hypothetical protein